MPAFVDLSGEQFGRWTVLRRNLENKSVKVVWLCRCSCGKEASVLTSSLNSGKSTSCGCLRIQSITKHHGAYRSEYMIWTSMKQRCHNPNANGFKHYGARGITVCERWLNSFANFIADLGPRPSPGHQIDRFPNGEGNYEPGNVRWATRAEQAANRCTTTFYTHEGKTMHLADWAKHLNSTYTRLFYRLKRGLTFEQAVTKESLRRRCPTTGKTLSMT